MSTRKPCKVIISMTVVVLEQSLNIRHYYVHAKKKKKDYRVTYFPHKATGERHLMRNT